MNTECTERTRACRPSRGPNRWLRGEPAPDARLPRSNDHVERVTAMLDGAAERGRLVDPLVARSIYDEVEYLTRETGTMFVTRQALADRVNAARDRLAARCARALRGRSVTDERVGAVLRRMVDAGWLRLVRKTARQAVYVVGAVASAVALELLANNSLPTVVEVPLDPRDNSGSGPVRRRCTSRDHASRLVDRHRSKLRARGVPRGKVTGAWWRYLAARLAFYDGDPAVLDREARWLDEAMSGFRAAVWLGDEALVSGHARHRRGT